MKLPNKDFLSDQAIQLYAEQFSQLNLSYSAVVLVSDMAIRHYFYFIQDADAEAISQHVFVRWLNAFEDFLESFADDEGNIEFDFLRDLPKQWQYFVVNLSLYVSQEGGSLTVDLIHELIGDEESLVGGLFAVFEQPIRYVMQNVTEHKDEEVLAALNKTYDILMKPRVSSPEELYQRLLVSKLSTLLHALREEKKARKGIKKMALRVKFAFRRSGKSKTALQISAAATALAQVLEAQQGSRIYEQVIAKACRVMEAAEKHLRSHKQVWAYPSKEVLFAPLKQVGALSYDFVEMYNIFSSASVIPAGVAGRRNRRKPRRRPTNARDVNIVAYGPSERLRDQKEAELAEMDMLEMLNPLDVSGDLADAEAVIPDPKDGLMEVGDLGASSQLGFADVKFVDMKFEEDVESSDESDDVEQASSAVALSLSRVTLASPLKQVDQRVLEKLAHDGKLQTPGKVRSLGC